MGVCVLGRKVYLGGTNVQLADYCRVTVQMQNWWQAVGIMDGR